MLKRAEKVYKSLTHNNFSKFARFLGQGYKNRSTPPIPGGPKVGRFPRPGAAFRASECICYAVMRLGPSEAVPASDRLENGSAMNRRASKPRPFGPCALVREKPLYPASAPLPGFLPKGATRRAHAHYAPERVRAHNARSRALAHYAPVYAARGALGAHRPPARMHARVSA